MGEYNEQTKRPHLYERIAPETRFVLAADDIVTRLGEPPYEGDTTTLIAAWPQKPQGYHYKLQMKANLTGFTCTLEHYIDELPANRPLTRYVTSVEGPTVFPITVFDAEGRLKNLDTEEEKAKAMRQLLSILAEAAPQVAHETLENIFNHRFENLAGAYILSDLAREGSKTEINKEAARAASEDFAYHIHEIEERVLRRSKRKDSPAKQEFVTEAVTTRRGRTNKNEYKLVDVVKVAERVAGDINRTHGKRWKYTVTPEQ